MTKNNEEILPNQESLDFPTVCKEEYFEIIQRRFFILIEVIEQYFHYNFKQNNNHLDATLHNITKNLFSLTNTIQKQKKIDVAYIKGFVWDLFPQYLDKQQLINLLTAEIDSDKKITNTKNNKTSANDLSQLKISIRILSYILDELSAFLSKNQTISESQHKCTIQKFNNTIAQLRKNFKTYENSKFEIENECNNDLIGLALSGGGIRSAAFNLGILQGLEQSSFKYRSYNILKSIDYLSTVSGGGYIGSALTYFKQLQSQQPSLKPSSLPFTKDQINYFRKYASYLTPGDGINQMSLIAAIIRGTLINFLFIFPILIFIFWFSLHVSFKNILATPNSYFLPESFILIIISLLVFYLWLTIKKRLPIPDQFNFWPSLIELIPCLLFHVAFIFAIYFYPLFEEYKNNWLLFLVPIAATTAWAFVSVLKSTFFENGKQIPLSSSQFNPLRTIFFEILTWTATAGLISIIFSLQKPQELITIDQNIQPTLFIFFAMMSMVFLFKYLISNLFFTIFSGTDFRLKFQLNKYFSAEYGSLINFALVFMLLSFLPYFYYLLNQWVPLNLFPPNSGTSQKTMLLNLSLIFVTGIVFTIIAARNISSGNKTDTTVSLMLSTGFSFLLITIIMSSYALAELFKNDFPFPLTLVILWIITGIVANINGTSLHRYYRNRLLEAFLYAELDHDKINRNTDLKGNLKLSAINIKNSGAPFHIINTNIITVGSKHKKYSKRGGDCFIFTPKHIGATCTGWIPTSDPNFNKNDLATAMAISGAAVDPNTGDARSWPLLTFIMALLNLRLGYWMLNPGIGKINPLKLLFKESWFYLIFQELFSLPSDKNDYVRLSDGGHFENLGLYELIRRQCKTIIVSDAGADPHYNFDDFANVCEKVRVDFEARIEIDITPLKPKTLADKRVKQAVVEGTIHYKNNKTSKLFYIKTTLFPDLPYDLIHYHQKHNSFPDEPTTDQFFSERQFEAYRELGFLAGKHLDSKEAIN